MKGIIDNIVTIIDSDKQIINLIIGLCVLLITLIFNKQLSKVILNTISKVFFRKKEEFVQPFKNSLQKPLATLFIATGIFVCIYINYSKAFIFEAFKIALILIACWAIVNYMSNNLFLLFHFGADADDKMNTTFIKFISNIIKIIVIAFAVVMVISELGYNINGLLTGIGVGGLAISLAAQEAVSNLISGFIIVFEKPFIVGELISTSTIYGYVEEVQMRSTTIRTLEDTLVTVPNSELTSNAITNITRMNKRLVTINIGLTYSTSNELMQKCSDDIKQYLLDNENVVNFPIRVHFREFEGSSLNMLIEFYTTKTDYNDYLVVINDLNYKVKEIVEANGANFAFPSTSVYLENKKDA